jgi:hypothetical protein
LASAGGQHLSPSSGDHGKAAVPAKVGPNGEHRPLCFSNILDDAGDALTSQNFEPAFDAYDTMAADNFALRNKCVVTEVDVLGQYYNGTGPAVSENVTIYRGSPDSTPGKVISAQTVAGADTLGSFVIPIEPVRLKPGRYWLSVQANMDFAVGGQWGWENSSTLRGKPAQWQNPGDGFGTGCTTWSQLQSCLGAPGPDLLFQIVH